MRYLMKQKFFTLGADFAIKDENQQDHFVVSGKVFTIGRKWTFKDMQGNELARIEQQLMAWRRTFHVYRNNERAATITKSLFRLFGTSFHIDVAGGEPYAVTGNFWHHEYTFTRGGATAASVSKKFFSWSDTYGIDIADGEDDVLILAAAVVIDACCHGEK